MRCVSTQVDSDITIAQQRRVSIASLELRAWATEFWRVCPAAVVVGDTSTAQAHCQQQRDGRSRGAEAQHATYCWTRIVGTDLDTFEKCNTSRVTATFYAIKRHQATGTAVAPGQFAERKHTVAPKAAPGQLVER